MKVIEGLYTVRPGRFALVVSRFNSLVTAQLLAGARDCILRHGGKEEDLTVVWVPGAFEIPQVVRKLADSGQYQAVVALGAVIRGSTPHFDQVVAGVTRGVGEASYNASIPVIFGVLTTDNLEQALERAGSKAGNKGWDAALTAIEMASVLDQIK